MKIIQPYCLKASQEKNREESIRNVMPDMIDEGKDEGWMRADNEFYLLQLNASSLQKRREAAGLKR